MKFTKMQGIGNDYVYINCLKETVRDPQKLAVIVSDRHFGIGSDGLILIKPSDAADFEMDMYNADGSRGKMCGNGIRCVGKYVYDYGLTDKTKLDIMTGSGIRHLELTVRDGRVALVTVDMGTPVLKAADVPVRSDMDRVISAPLTAAGRNWLVTCVSMGNPHCVVRLDDQEDLAGFPIEEIGPGFENHDMFPDRVNTEFIRILDRHTIEMRVWERGSGETLACGTGACASAVAAALNGWTEPEVTVRLLGGDLQVRWDRQNGMVFMTGPAEVVFDGEIGGKYVQGQ